MTDGTSLVPSGAPRIRIRVAPCRGAEIIATRRYDCGDASGAHRMILLDRGARYRRSTRPSRAKRYQPAFVDFHLFCASVLFSHQMGAPHWNVTGGLLFADQQAGVGGVR